MDYFLISDFGKSLVTDSMIYDEEVRCTDHCPIRLLLDVKDWKKKCNREKQKTKVVSE